MENESLPESSQAVFSVCASPDVSISAAAACAAVSGSSYVGEFKEYFSHDRRPQLSPALTKATGCVALIDCDRDPDLALRSMEQLRTLLIRNLSIVAYSTSMDKEYLLHAMRAGCNEFLLKPAGPGALQDALERFSRTHIAEAGGQPLEGKVMSFFGVKGGAGATTLAVHLANTLVRRHRKRTLLIDHHHELGHVSLYLGLKESQYHFDELLRNAERLDGNLLHGYITKHTSGLDVLASPDICAHGYDSQPDEIKTVIGFLKRHYDYVIIDSSIAYKDLVPAIQQSSDAVYVVSTADVAALRDLARRVEHLSLTDPAGGEIRILINRSTSDDAVSPEQIQKAIRFPVWMSIPNQYADLLRAINAGEPIPPQSRSAFTKQINTWADKTVSTGAVVRVPTDKPSFRFWRVKAATAA